MYGTFSVRLDDKGRMILPAKIRPEMAGGMVFTRGQDNTLFLFTPEQFEDFRQQMSQAAFDTMSPRDYDMMLFSGVDEQTPDKQWRVTISPKLRRYARLDRDIVLVGLPTRYVVWDAAAWDEYEERMEPSYAQLTREVR